MNLDTDLHFTCFIEAKVDGDGLPHVVELDGRRAGIFDRGRIKEKSDLLMVRFTSFLCSELDIYHGHTGSGQVSQRHVHEICCWEYPVLYDFAWATGGVVIVSVSYRYWDEIGEVIIDVVLLQLWSCGPLRLSRCCHRIVFTGMNSRQTCCLGAFLAYLFPHPHLVEEHFGK